MPRSEPVPENDRERLLSEAHVRVAPYGVAFAKEVRGTAVEDLCLAGSGTLVRAAATFGILTADHVLANLPDGGELGVVLHLRPEDRVHRFTIQMEYARKLRVGKASNDEYGPDIGVLVLPAVAVSQFRASGSFVDLRVLRDRMNTPPPVAIGGWVLFGYIEEWTADAPLESGFKKVKQFRSLCGGGGLTREEDRDGFDYFYFEVTRHEAPSSFAGLSGGALWHIIPAMRDGRIEVQEVLLSGVPFFETGPRDGSRSIISHGRRSIVERVLSEMERAG